MSRLSWQNDPHGCFADYENERIAEAMHAAHLGGECTPGECEWCESEKQAEIETYDNEVIFCPSCGHTTYRENLTSDGRCEYCD